MGEFDENFEDNVDVPRPDDTTDVEASDENLFGATWLLENLEEDTDLEAQYREADSKYQAVKNDIEMSRTPEEQSYWLHRGEEIWQERDELGGRIEQEKQNKNNNK